MTLQEILRSKDRCGGCKDQDKNVYKSECFDCLTKKKDNYELDESLKVIQENAAKWDMIQWAIDNKIKWIMKGEPIGAFTYITELEFKELEREYKEREQNE